MNQVQAPTIQEPLKETVEEEAGSGPETELIGTEVVGVQEGYSSNGSGEEGGVAVTGQDPRLTLLWEWQCPLPPSTNLSTRVTCMAWNKVHHHDRTCGRVFTFLYALLTLGCTFHVARHKLILDQVDLLGDAQAVALVVAVRLELHLVGPQLAGAMQLLIQTSHQAMHMPLSPSSNCR